MQFVVGITGHRWNKISPDAADRVRRELAHVFSEVNTAVLNGAQADAKGSTIRLISCLAEGADQLAVWARPAGWSLEAMLPFPRDRYLEDFAPRRATGGIDRRSELTSALAVADAISEPTGILNPDVAYEKASARMLARSDLLVAVWDGGAAAGRGGTETVIQSAVQGGLPVVWIHSVDDVMPRLMWSAIGDRPQAMTPALLRKIIEGRLHRPHSGGGADMSS